MAAKHLHQFVYITPVMPIMTFTDKSDVVEEANNTEYGLASYLFTSNLDDALAISELLEFGTVCINEPYYAVNMPHGGIKESGIGSVLLQSSLIASVFFCPVIFGLHWKGVSATGAICAMLGGGLTVLIWRIVGVPFGLNEVFPGVLVSGLLVLIISKFTKPVGQESIHRFFNKGDATRYKSAKGI
jgi:hypothetical protein